MILFKSNRIKCLLATLGFFALTPYALADTTEALKRGQEAAMTCVACHQVDGNGADLGAGSPWPRLAGLNAEYLQAQLNAFKEGTRQSAEMKPFADLLSEQQIVDVSIYFSSLEAKKPPVNEEVSSETLKAGEKLANYGDWDKYIVSCISCHGPGNQGVGHVFPEIAGQHAGYIESQLRAWQNGTRTEDPLGLMQAISNRMTEDDIVAVSAWLATQEPAGQNGLSGESNE